MTIYVTHDQNILHAMFCKTVKMFDPGTIWLISFGFGIQQYTIID